MTEGLGRALGPLPAVDDGDRALAARLVAGVLAPVPAAVRRERPRAVSLARRLPGRAIRRWVAAAVATLVAGTAGAALWSSWPRLARRGAGGGPPAGIGARVGTGVRVGTGPSVAAPPDEPPDDSEPEAPPFPVPAPIAGQPAAAPGPHPRRAASASVLSPEDLLRQANEARHARRIDEAVRSYRALQRAFPRSPEARLSFLSLGNLYLADGAAAAALVAFDAYLDGGGDGGELREEALLGKARALVRLGRVEDERAAWRSLLEARPESEYRWRAQQRLHELGSGSP
jgi:TolA-binding protein